MDWLQDIIKRLEVSRALVVATFVTSAVMTFGPRALPDLVPKLPDPWPPIAFAAMVLTGCLLAIWSLAGIWGLLREGATRTKRTLVSQTLTPTEKEALAAMGHRPTDPINLENIDYASAPFTRLEFLHLMRGLEEKGLVEFNPYSSELVSLTEAGQTRALAIQRSQQAKSAA